MSSKFIVQPTVGWKKVFPLFFLIGAISAVLYPYFFCVECLAPRARAIFEAAPLLASFTSYYNVLWVGKWYAVSDAKNANKLDEPTGKTAALALLSFALVLVLGCSWRIVLGLP